MPWKSPSPAKSAHPSGVRPGLDFLAINGQSLSVGQSYGLISTVASSVHKMFSGGVRVEYRDPATASTWYTSLVGLKEQNDTQSWQGALMETPCSGAARMISQLVAAENGQAAADACRMLLSAPGYGATRADQLTVGSIHFQRLVHQAWQGRRLADEAGWSFAASAQAIIQGESDYLDGTSRAAYATTYEGWARGWAAYGKAAAGQEANPLTLVCQIASHLHTPTVTPTIALAQLDAADAVPLLIRVACAMTQFDYNGDDWHMLSPDTLWLGAYIGLAWKRIIYDGLAWSALRPTGATKNGNTIRVAYHVPVAPLVFDRDWMTAIENEGIQVVDADGDAVAISSVAVTGDGAHVDIVCADSSGTKVRHGWAGGTAPGRQTGARCTLRDSQGSTISFVVGDGDTRRMDNWCVISETTVA